MSGQHLAEPIGPEEAELASADLGVRRGVARYRRRQRVRRRRIVVGLVGLVLVVLVVMFCWYELEEHALGGQGAPVVLQVAKGETTSAVVGQLAQKGVIGSSFAFHLNEVVHGTPSVLAGGYLMHQNSSFAAVRKVLAAGPDIEAVTVRGGQTLKEVSAQVGQLSTHSGAHFLAVATAGAVHSPWQPKGSQNLEGLVGSGTYTVVPGETDTQLLQAMVARFNDQAVAAGLTPAAAAALGKTPYQVIVAASVVEKEGYILKNMPEVARVIYNRLSQADPLQMDATVLYSLGQDGGTVTPADLKIDTPYNTYLHTGLPPTPICIPSMSALRAALHPPAGHWLYFEVVQKDGTEAFSDTFSQQLANEELAQSRGLG